MEVLALIFGTIVVFLLWLPYHLLSRRQHGGASFTEFADMLMLVALLGWCPITWIVLIYMGLKRLFESPEKKAKREAEKRRLENIRARSPRPPIRGSYPRSLPRSSGT